MGFTDGLQHMLLFEFVKCFPAPSVPNSKCINPPLYHTIMFCVGHVGPMYSGRFINKNEIVWILEFVIFVISVFFCFDIIY